MNTEYRTRNEDLRSEKKRNNKIYDLKPRSGGIFIAIKIPKTNSAVGTK